MCSLSSFEMYPPKRLTVVAIAIALIVGVLRAKPWLFLTASKEITTESPLRLSQAERRSMSSLLPVPRQPHARTFAIGSKTASSAVTRFYGRFPVKHVRIDLTTTRSGRIHGGVTYPEGHIQVKLGRNTAAADFDDDWLLTHEMFHLGFPDMDERYLWMQEGLSDYLEPLARARIRNLSEEKVWVGFVEGMPKGQPEAGDRGLDRTHTWGRTYWGGAIFWLLADLRIREQTANARSIDDAIRAILEAGGDNDHDWTLDKVIATADRASGTTVLKNLHDELGAKPVKVDLDALWARLGIRHPRGGRCRVC